jgi:hypothetical protein
MHASAKNALSSFLKQYEGAAIACKINRPIAAGRNEAHGLMFTNAAAVKSNGDDITQLCWPIRWARTVESVD